MVAETTSGGSVFDVGTIFSIENSDVMRAIFRHKVFSDLSKPEKVAELLDELETGIGGVRLPKGWLSHPGIERARREGLRTHHEGMVDAVSGEVVTGEFPAQPSTYNVVRRFQIIKPEQVKLPRGWAYDYAPYRGQDGFVVPLEYIVRLGITSGSSVFKKYLRMGDTERVAFAEALGVGSELKAWEYFEEPIFDLTTKYEPEDRNLDTQEALLISTLTGERFSESILTVILCTMYVAKLMGDMGLRLWDIKWELAISGEDLYVVDTIDTDSLRATYTIADGGNRYIAHFNKQAMRDYYRIMHSDWLSAVNEAKEAAKQDGRPFTEILAEGQARGDYAGTPEPAAEFMALQARKMGVLSDYLMARADAAQTQDAVATLAGEELAYYRESGNFEAYCGLNQMPE
jgi:phosphoribosylaminoimidazole-succinocarboxamide synthase